MDKKIIHQILHININIANYQLSKLRIKILENIILFLICPYGSIISGLGLQEYLLKNNEFLKNKIYVSIETLSLI